MASSVALAGLPAFMLLRKSQADKAEEQRQAAVGQVYDALANQRQALVDLAARDGVTVPPEHICTEIKSGASLNRRYHFQALLEVIRSLPKPGALLYCVNTARISRGLLTERGMLQDLFISKGVIVRTTEGFTDLSSADERLLYEFKGALAHHYLLRYKEDVARTRAVQVQHGRVRNGKVPYGYRWDKNTKRPVPHPGEFPILQAFCEQAFTLSTHRLAERYGIPQDRILRALRSPMICGWPAKTTGGVTGQRQDYLPREEWTWPAEQGDYPVAITRADWERLQVVLDRRRTKEEGAGLATENHWCRDVVRFPQCPGPVGLGTYSSPTASFPTYIRRIDDRGTRYYIKRDLVHDAVTEAIRPVLESPRFINYLFSCKASKGAAPPPDEALLKSEQARLLAKAARLRDMESEPDFHPAEIPANRQQRKDLLREVDAIASLLGKQRSRAPTLSTVEAEQLLAVVGELQGGVWEAQPDTVKRLIVNVVVEAAVVTLQPPERGPWHRRSLEVVLQAWAANRRCSAAPDRNRKRGR